MNDHIGARARRNHDRVLRPSQHAQGSPSHGASIIEAAGIVGRLPAAGLTHGATDRAPLALQKIQDSQTHLRSEVFYQTGREELD